MKKLLTLILAILLVLSSFTSCFAVKLLDKKVPSETIAPVSPVTTDTAELPETDEPKEPAEPNHNYQWLVEAGKFKGDIQPPIYNVNEICPLEISILTENNSYYLVDYDGTVRAVLDTSDYIFCTICGSLTNHINEVDPQSFTLSNYNGGHGGMNYINVFDTDLGKLFSLPYGFAYETEYDGTIAVSKGIRIYSDDYERSTYKCDKYGAVNNGDIIVPFEHDMYISYSSDVAAFRKDGKWGYFNVLGEQVLPYEYDPSEVDFYNVYLEENTKTPYHASCGYIALNKGGMWGYATTSGEMITDFEFEEARPVYDNKAWVKTEAGWGVIELPDNTDPLDMTEIEAKWKNNGYQYVYNGMVEFYGSDMYCYSLYYANEAGSFEDTVYITANGNMLCLYN